MDELGSNNIDPNTVPKTDHTVQTWILSKPENYGSFGRELRISPKSNVAINAAGLKMEFMVETVTVLIGIGKDNVGWLVITKAAWEVFKGGAEVNITTTKEFKEGIK